LDTASTQVVVMLWRCDTNMGPR